MAWIIGLTDNKEEDIMMDETKIYQHKDSYPPAHWVFPYGINLDGTPKIEREMTEHDYENYKEVNKKIFESFQQSRDLIPSCLGDADVAIKIYKLDAIFQDENRCKCIPYPASDDSSKTFATSGMFQLIFHSILSYFGKEESLENLAMVANYGNWHHPNGTWHHYIDTMCQAYGLGCYRFSNAMNIKNVMTNGGLAVVLLDHSMKPSGHGNLLVIVTAIKDGNVEFFSPAFTDGKIHGASLRHFFKNVKVMWGVENHPEV